MTATHPLPVTRCEFQRNIFASFGEVRFRRSLTDGVPIMAMPLGEREAQLPLGALRRELGIEDDSPDGRMLDLIDSALDYVPSLAPGDKLPSEVLTGDASCGRGDRGIARQDLPVPGAPVHADQAVANDQTGPRGGPTRHGRPGADGLVRVWVGSAPGMAHISSAAAADRNPLTGAYPGEFQNAWMQTRIGLPGAHPVGLLEPKPARLSRVSHQVLYYGNDRLTVFPYRVFIRDRGLNEHVSWHPLLHPSRAPRYQRR